MPKAPATPRAVLYARFSPRPNADECQSCQVQLADLRIYCQQRGIEVLGSFHDDALSGGDGWDDRPGMLAASAAAKRGTLFLVRSFDRLFRDTQKGLAFAAMLESKGVQIVSTTEEAASLNTPEARLMRAIFLSIAEYQRAIIRARTKSRMLEHQRNGRRMGHRDRIPYGWQLDPADPMRMIHEPGEQQIIGEIAQLHQQGHLSLRQICRELERRGHLCRGRRNWHHHAVGRIIKRLLSSMTAAPLA